MVIYESGLEGSRRNLELKHSLHLGGAYVHTPQTLHFSAALTAHPVTAYPPDPMPPQTGLTGGASLRISPYTKDTKYLASYAAHLYLNWKSKGREVGSPIQLTQGPRQEGQHITHILPEVLGLGPGRKGCGNQERMLQLWQMKLKGEGHQMLQRGRRSQGGTKKSEMNGEWGHQGRDGKEA